MRKYLSYIRHLRKMDYIWLYDVSFLTELMFNLILFGPPGSGKGTQSEKLVNTFGLTHISTGELLREHIAKETKLGKEAKGYINSGKLVPDELVIRIISAIIDEANTNKGLLFDGFPRTTAQAEALDELLSRKKLSISLMIALDIPEKELIIRLLKRRETSNRNDDLSLEVIQARIIEYHEKTAPVSHHYNKMSKLVFVKGVGSVDEVFNSISYEINKMKEGLMAVV